MVVNIRGTGAGPTALSLGTQVPAMATVMGGLLKVRMPASTVRSIR
jgi:hypothetical protein